MRLGPAHAGVVLADFLAMSVNQGLTDIHLPFGRIKGGVDIKRDRVYKWIERKDLPAHKVGRL